MLPEIKYSNLQGKNAAIAAACYFSVYKLVGWDPATFTCSK